jgi:hypothetical protein
MAGIAGTDIGDYASQYIGTPYVWGGNDLSSGVDCSGLVQQVFKNFGIDLPRTTYDMIGEGKPVSIKGLRPGDLVFFDTSSKSGADHVGIYLGGGKMIHAPRPGKAVEVVDITKGYYLDTFMGGRRISGVHAVGAKDSDYAESPKLTPEELAASYGWAYGFLNSNSELKGKFQQAVDESWTPQKFQAEIRDTKWWKETSDTRRQAQVAQKTDPATWNAQMDAATIQVRQLAAEIGAAIPDSKISKIAKNMLETGMDESQLRYALGGYVTFTKDGTLKGEAGMHEYTMKQYAYNMGIKLDDQTIKNQAQRVVRKVATTQDYESEVRDQAKSMFPAYAKQIDSGSTLKDIASPYMSLMSQELEIPDNSIDVMNPLIKKALNGLDADGNPGGVSLTDFQNQLRSDPRWKQTNNAQDSMMSTGLKVLKDMGLVAS